MVEVPKELTNEEVRSIFVAIANGAGGHGSFVMAFADALLRADSTNFNLLKPVAEELIRNYDLCSVLEKKV